MFVSIQRLANDYLVANGISLTKTHTHTQPKTNKQTNKTTTKPKTRTNKQKNTTKPITKTNKKPELMSC